MRNADMKERNRRMRRIFAALGALALVANFAHATSASGPSSASATLSSPGRNFRFIDNGAPVSEVGSHVPEPGTIISGALVLMPFGASILRILRGRQTL